MKQREEERENETSLVFTVFRFTKDRTQMFGFAVCRRISVLEADTVCSSVLN